MLGDPRSEGGRYETIPSPTGGGGLADRALTVDPGVRRRCPSLGERARGRRALCPELSALRRNLRITGERRSEGEWQRAFGRHHLARLAQGAGGRWPLMQKSAVDSLARPAPKGPPTRAKSRAGRRHLPMLDRQKFVYAAIDVPAAMPRSPKRVCMPICRVS
ncbi:MAG: hypothetical protein QOJ93_1820 [Actinomycetota bacterium]|nr:hypothetical protein [Actinomycetota bacterium]